MVLTVALVMAAMVLASSIPALARHVPAFEYTNANGDSPVYETVQQCLHDQSLDPSPIISTCKSVFAR
jgi:hypothetical protein